MLPTKFRPGAGGPGELLVDLDQLGVPLAGSSPFESSATRGRRDPDHRLGERRAHVRELDQVLGPAGDVRADVEQQHRAAPGIGSGSASAGR